MLATKLSVLVILITFSSFLFANSEQDSNCDPINPMNISNCNKLVTLGAEFGWNVHNSTQIDILFSIKLSAGHHGAKWLAWGVNPGPGGPKMVGTRALIGIEVPNKTLVVNQYNITSDTKHGCRLQSSPKFDDVIIKNMRGLVSHEAPNKYMSISATLVFPDPATYNISKLNHVWQVGYEVDVEHLEPRMHSTALRNVDSTEILNLNTGHGISIGHHRHRLRTVHGILNILGWGTLLPLGVIIARYFKKCPFHCERWKELHVFCQICGYILGTAGWAVGLWLGHASRHYSFPTHRILAMFIFAFTTLQMLALRLRPKETDDYRKFWDMYHHFLGYSLLAVISVNIFQGIAILKPNKRWLWVYVGILALFGCVALGIEIYSWYTFCKSRSRKKNATAVADNTAGRSSDPQTSQSPGPGPGPGLLQGSTRTDKTT